MSTAASAQTEHYQRLAAIPQVDTRHLPGAHINPSNNRKEVFLHPHQAKAFRAQARFVALVAGTGGGKTFFGGPWICNEIAKYPNDQWLILAPTYKILSRATMPTFLEFVRGTEYEGKYLEHKGQYHLPDGGIIYCLSTDNWKGIEGGQFRAAWLDEAGQMTRMAWIAVQARLGLKQGRCLFTTTPYPSADADWLLIDVVDYAKAGDPDYFATQFRSIDNPHYPPEEYERAKRAMSDALFQMRYGGQFTKLSGLVYPDLDQTFTDAPVPRPALDGTWERWGGLDWGFRDPFVALVAALDPQGTLHLFHEHYQPRWTIDEHIRYLMRPRQDDEPNTPDEAAEYGGPFDNVTYFGDPSGAQQIADCNATGMAVVPANNDILAGISAVTARINARQLVIYKKYCPNLAKEANVYRYPCQEEIGASARVTGEKPLDKDNHAMDALRYMIRGVDGDTISEGPIYGAREQEPQLTPEEQSQLVDKFNNVQTLAERYNQGEDGNGFQLNNPADKATEETRGNARARLSKRQTHMPPEASQGPGGTESDDANADDAWLSPDNEAIWNVFNA